jgi:fructosamine-3-kinase
VNVAGVELVHPKAVFGGDICRAWRARTAQSPHRTVFAKTLSGAPSGFFAAEARGLASLRVDAGPPVPEVIAVGDDGLVLEWVEPGPADSAAAVAFGRRLAALHAKPAAGFGASFDGFIGSLPLPNAPALTWPDFYVERRVVPYLAALAPAERRDVEAACARIHDIAGPPEPAATIHGDLWSGNVLWGADGAGWLIDAASSHGGHRETDLALLQLFGAPQLSTILDAYQEVAPLAGGWQQRLPLHQLHPLLVHATLFGGESGARAAAAARAALSAG